MNKKRNSSLLILLCCFLFILSSCNFNVCNHEWNDATCTTPKTCEKCGETDGSKLGHNLTPATCTTPSKCERCEEEINAALGHEFYGYYQSDETYHWEICFACKFEEKEIHLFVDGICIICGYEKSIIDIPTEDKPTEDTPTEEVKNEYLVIVSNEIVNGRIVVNKDKAYPGDVILIDARAMEGYELESIYVNEELLNGTSFIMGECDITITATFIPSTECSHYYNDEGVCIECGQKAEKSYLNELFGYNITTYTNNEQNPYNIDLNKYGSDITAYFYEPNLSSLTDPYTNVNKTEFYKNYTPATSYEDAYFRSKHYLMSGDITEQYYKPTEGKLTENGKAIKLSTATYILNTDGSYLAYIPNTFDDDNYIIFYGGGYTSLNEVAAYLLAFGEVPKNTISAKGSSGQKDAISKWGEYGRVNDSVFSGDTSKYPYEPELPKILGANKITYHEMDFGTTGGYKNSNSNGTSYTQKLYNNGSKIDRGAARMVFVCDSRIKSIDERHVFYTYNHYNDFQEYLNYHNGWGYRFGNESAGNEYCGNSSDYYALKCVPPTKYPEVLLKKYSNVA